MALDYTQYVPSGFQTSPKFLALVQLVTSAISANTDLVNSFQTLFDLDTAVGQQLDYTGQWIGMNRNIHPAVTSCFFSWGDSTHNQNNGWSMAHWQGNYSYNGVTTLDDPEYRQLLYAKVALNQWDGSIPGVLNELSIAFPKNQFFIMDKQNMSMDIVVVGPMTQLTQALLTRGSFDCRPAGVLVNNYWMASVPNTPVFAWSENTSTMAGWGTGSWISRVTPA